MTNTIIARKLLSAAVAAAVFAIGAYIGWHFAGRLFQGETALPVVATIQIEGNGTYEPFHPGAGSQPRDAARQPAAVIRQDIDGRGRNQASAAPPLPDEEREFVKALQWAERYRQKHAALERSTAAHPGWAEVAEHAMHFGQGRVEVQKVIQAQIERERRLKTAQPARIASAVTAARMPLVGDAAALITPAAEVRKDAQTRTARRTTHRRNARADRAIGGRRQTSMCFLQWLEAVLTEPVAERRARRQARHTRFD